jgi:hypothetical protein
MAAFIGPTVTPIQQTARRTVEKATAVTEATCAHSTGLGQLSKQLDRKYQRQLDTLYRNVINEKTRMEADALSRARTIISND